MIRDFIRIFWRPIRKGLVSRRQKREGIFYRDAYFFMNQNPAYATYHIGRLSYGKPLVVNDATGATLRIGSFCSIAEGVQIFLGGNHRSDWVTTYPFNIIFDEGKHIRGHPTTKGDVVIGADVWIASDAMILSGVVIGHGAVIGAGAVVSKSIPPYAIVVGNPAKVVKYRFDSEQIAALLRISWWDWPLDKIKMNIGQILQEDIDLFIKKHDPHLSL